MRYESPSRLVRALRNAGAENLRLHWVPILPQHYQSLQRIVETRAARLLLRHVRFLGALISHAFVVSANRSENSQIK
jgi:hypothetical protein